MMCGSDFFLGLLALLFPPVAVWVKRGICSADSIINLALCCLGLLPGLLHAWYIIYTYPDTSDSEYERVAASDPEANGSVTYYYVQRGNNNAGGRQQQPSSGAQQQYRSHGQPTYGGVAPMPGSASRHQFPGQQQSGVKNAFAGAGAPPAKAPLPPANAGGESGEGASNALPPPTYAEAVKGDHKVQT
ncbi:uncharacterized protein K452DRAFT_247322 [Aplosporella prunicola CBS 121167]|uniref:Stress response RCI peptide n=1 Tax=Aplosporella prunicola CBS 121167 TaxID=1176127 RepID=A0A6A6BI93_9PEZI|nr:uncharacterized protein K452DRAFT_247322 [Aplosporella prunicola CBS 121167]KAF2143850.1 hypothetical protein K452DRAFT_247322 [Aplosporella prunicola CBS 121167]